MMARGVLKMIFIGWEKAQGSAVMVSADKPASDHSLELDNSFIVL